MVFISVSHLRLGPGLKWAAEEEDGALVRVEACWSGECDAVTPGEGEGGQLIRCYYRHQTPRRQCGVSATGHYQQDNTITVCVCTKYVSQLQND